MTKRQPNTPKALAEAEKLLVKRLSRAMEKTAEKLATRLEQEEKNLGNDLNEILSQDNSLYIEYVVRLAKRIALFGAKTEDINLEVGIDFNLLNEEIDRYAQGIIEQHSVNQSGSILRNTSNKIYRLIGQWVRDGSTYWQVADLIRQQVGAGVFSPARAEMIAISQLGRAYEEGRHQVVEQGKRQGDTFQKIWDTVWDDRVTWQCNANAGQGWILDEEQRGSGDKVAPRNTNPKCRCTTNYRRVEASVLYEDDDTTYDPEIGETRGGGS